MINQSVLPVHAHTREHPVYFHRFDVLWTPTVRIARLGPSQMQMDHATQRASQSFVNRLALRATVHCLTGCSIGEVLGMIIGTSLGWGNWATVALAVVLAFAFGYLLTLVPLLRAGMELGTSLALAFASDTLSITIMEIVDNAVMLVIPGAMEAGLTEPLFWGSLILSLILAGIGAFPVNRWLVARGRGHALMQKHHGHDL